YLELLKEMVPNVKRAAILRDATDPAGTGQWGAIQSVAPLLGLELTPIGMGDAGEIERGLSAFARITDRGLVITGSAPAAVHRDLIISLADKHRCRRRGRSRRVRSSPQCQWLGFSTADHLTQIALRRSVR